MVESGLPCTFRPLGARIATGVAAVVIVGAVAFLWLMLPADVKATFSTFQRFTLLAVFAAMLAVLYGIFRMSARADESGLTVTNGYRVHRYEWAQLVRVNLSRNRPFAVLDLDDGSTIPVMGIQTADGERAWEQARKLSRLLERQTRTDDR